MKSLLLWVQWKLLVASSKIYLSTVSHFYERRKISEHVEGICDVLFSLTFPTLFAKFSWRGHVCSLKCLQKIIICIKFVCDFFCVLKNLFHIQKYEEFLFLTKYDEKCQRFFGGGEGIFNLKFIRRDKITYCFHIIVIVIDNTMRTKYFP